MFKQAFNKKTDSWVKYKKLEDGTTRIINVKQKNPAKPFKGIKLK